MFERTGHFVSIGILVLIILVAFQKLAPSFLESGSSANNQIKMPDSAAITGWAAKHFEVWSAHDMDGLGKIYDEKSSLRDWDGSAEGKEKVLEMIAGIFKNVPTIKAEVVNIFPSQGPKGPVAACEILVKLPDKDLKVTDIIEFTEEGLITSVRAYLG